MIFLCWVTKCITLREKHIGKNKVISKHYNVLEVTIIIKVNDRYVVSNKKKQISREIYILWTIALDIQLSKCGQPIGPSMLPTFNLTGDVLAVNKVPTWWGQLNNGDVVLMRSPENPRKHIVKRVLGVEGEMVAYLVDPANSDTTKTVMVQLSAYE